MDETKIVFQLVPMNRFGLNGIMMITLGRALQIVFATHCHQLYKDKSSRPNEITQKNKPKASWRYILFPMFFQKPMLDINKINYLCTEILRHHS